MLLIRATANEHELTITVSDPYQYWIRSQIVTTRELVNANKPHLLMAEIINNMGYEIEHMSRENDSPYPDKKVSTANRIAELANNYRYLINHSGFREQDSAVRNARAALLDSLITIHTGD